jgi:hypothetical protein
MRPRHRGQTNDRAMSSNPRIPISTPTASSITPERAADGPPDTPERYQRKPALQVPKT